MSKSLLQTLERAQKKIHHLRNPTNPKPNSKSNKNNNPSECLRSLESRNLMSLPKDIMQTLFDIVLKCNVFSFHTHIYQQVQGTAMGTKMAPSYANLFMDSLESSFLKDEPLQPALWKRYIDDILCVWTDSRESLEAFLHRLNSCHPTIHFTWTVSS